MKIAVQVETVRAMRERTGFGMQECRRTLLRAAMLQALDSATRVDELREVLRVLVEDF